MEEAWLLVGVLNVNPSDELSSLLSPVDVDRYGSVSSSICSEIGTLASLTIPKAPEMK
jgi:hypothetical protein